MATVGTPTPTPRRGPPPARWRRLPVVHQLRQSVGLQRGMLVAGLVLTGIFLLDGDLRAAARALRLRPAARRRRRRSARSSRPSAAHLLGHDGRRLRRAVPGDLGRPDGAAR